MKNQFVIACDLGTGGCKSSLYDETGACLDSGFEEYPTTYPGEAMHEQKPEDWWHAVRFSIKELLKGKDEATRSAVAGIGLSGHSLGLVPLDKDGTLLMDSVPIWSDSRPSGREMDPFFDKVPEQEWYRITGNGFPPALYTVFKILWMQNELPDIYSNTDTIIGTKDYINYLLTGKILTDYSYASGSGVYSLIDWDYSDRLLKAAGLTRDLFPEIIPSSGEVGTLLPEIAAELGLPESVKVVAGGVDNSCMALGAKCYKEGRIYNSIGSSSWIAVSSDKPVLEDENRPFVFTHVVPGQFASATAIFGAGTSYKWFTGILTEETGSADYRKLDAEADAVPPGSEKLLFNSSIAGGSSLDKSANVRGAFLGLTLAHSRAHMVRAVMEGVAFGLRVALDVLRDVVEVEDELTVVGGGSKSAIWRQIFADIYNINVVKTSVDQQAAALGAASLALVGCGIWEDYTRIDALHEIEGVSSPKPELRPRYEALYDVFKDATDYLADLGDRMTAL